MKDYIEVVNGSLIYHVAKNNEIDEEYKEFLKGRGIQIVYDENK